MVEKPGKLQPALIGGAILGVLSSIPIVSACCCLWVLMGGALAARILIKRSPVLPVTTGEGAVVGALAGVIGSAITLVITVPLNLMNNEANIEQMRQTAEQFGNASSMEPVIEIMRNSPVLFVLMVWLVSAVLIVAFAALGGILGVSLFEKRKGEQMPPPGPPGFAPPESPGEGPPPAY